MRNNLSCNPYIHPLKELLKRWEKHQWYRGKLGQFVAVNPKTDITPSDNDSLVSFIPMDAVGERNGEFNPEDVPYLQVSKGYTKFQDDDVIWAKITPCMQNGKSAVVRGLINGVGFGSTEFHVLRSKNLEIVIPDYIWAVLSTNQFLHVAQADFSGNAGQQRVSADFLRNLPIPLPPPDIQRALVADLDHARATRKAKLAEADNLLKGMDEVVMRELGLTVPPSESSLIFTVRLADAFKRLDVHYHQPYFKQLTDLIATIPYKELGQIIEFSHETINPETLDDSFFDYIEISGVDLQTGEISSTQELTSSPPSRAKMLVRHDDILVSLTRPHRGAIALVDKAQDGYVASTGFAILRQLTDENIQREYLLSVLRTNIGLKQMERGSSGGNYPAITEDELKKILVPTPSDAIQKNIITELHARRDRARQLRQEADAIWHEAQARFEQALLGE